MNTTATSPTDHNMEHRPGSFLRRVQSQAHDDLPRKGAFRQSHRDVDPGRIEPGQFPGRGPDRSSLTGNRDAQRDAHLKSAEWFDVEKFPTISFKSSRISLVRDGELSIEGDLTIRDVTRKVVFSAEGPTPPAKDPWGNTRVGVSATTKISRKDFGLTWNAALESGGVLVGDDVTISLDVQFVKA